MLWEQRQIMRKQKPHMESDCRRK